MKNFKNKYREQNGVSLVELMVVITILVIISTLSIMQFGSSRQQLKRQNVAQELKSAFERARFDSVKRRALGADKAKVTVNTNSFTLTTDVNGNGTIESADDVVNSFSGQNVTITDTTGNAMTFPVTVTFNQRGEVITTDNTNAAVSPIFLICNATCTSATATVSNSNLVLVTATGTVNLLSGGSSVPTFATPPVTNVSSNSQIRNDVRVP